MQSSLHVEPMVEDPLIASLALHQPITADVIRKAIDYQEAKMDVLLKNIEVLKTALARHLGSPASEPALQESARHSGAGRR
jgi:hypothetical protein